METRIEIKYGVKDSYWKPNLFTALGQIVFLPVSWALSLLLSVVVVLLDLAQMGSHYIEVRMTPKDILMPDGSIRKTKKT